MPTPLPQPFEVSPGPVLQAMRLGHADRLAEEQRGALKSAGALAAKGDLAGARNYLYGQGMMDEGARVDQMLRQADAATLAKTERFNSVIGNLALSVKSLPPEQQRPAWQTAIQTAKNAGLDVSKYEDPSSMDLLLSQSGMVMDKLKLEMERRQAQARENEVIYGRSRNEMFDAERRAATQREIDNTLYDRNRQSRLDARAENVENQKLEIQRRSLEAKETPAPYVFSPQGVGNKYTGEFRALPGGVGADSGKLGPDYRWRMKNGQPELDASGRPIAEPIPGSKGETVTPEVSARIGMADKFLGELPALRKSIEAGELGTSFGYKQDMGINLDFNLGRGKAQDIYRRIEDGSEALIRNLTGAGMNETEAKSYAGRFLPGRLDSRETVLSKLDNLSKALMAVKNRVMVGRGVAGGDELTREIAAKPGGQDRLPRDGTGPESRARTAEDPLGILSN